MEKAFKLLPPTMPNFIHYEVPSGVMQDGFDPGKNAIPVSSLSESEAVEYSDLMKQAFLEHWKKKQTIKTWTMTKEEIIAKVIEEQK